MQYVYHRHDPRLPTLATLLLRRMARVSGGGGGKGRGWGRGGGVAGEEAVVREAIRWVGRRGTGKAEVGWAYRGGKYVANRCVDVCGTT